MSGFPTPVPYVRELLELVTIYHPQLDNSNCLCGWGRWPAHLGRSHAAHVADVYEVLARGGLLMGATATGTVTHLTLDAFRSLCGRRLSNLVFRLDDGAPVAYAPHWASGAVTHGHPLCAACEHLPPSGMV